MIQINMKDIAANLEDEKKVLIVRWISSANSRY